VQRIQSALSGLIVDLVERGLLGTDLERVKVRRAPQWLYDAWPDKTKAMTVGTTVLFRPEVDTDWSESQITSLLVHELTHVRQFRQMGVATFVIRYLSDYLGGRRSGLSHFDAYEAIESEKEARDVAREYCESPAPE
jgi:hypothetical protein